MSEKKKKYPLVICYIAIENGHLLLIYPSKMVIFHGYVNLPEDGSDFGHIPRSPDQAVAALEETAGVGAVGGS